MKIKQFEYGPLSHFSYAIISDGKMALVDPERNPRQYYKYAEDNDAKIVEAVQKKPVPQVGIHFMKFCGKYDLERMSQQPNDYAQFLNKVYAV